MREERDITFNSNHNFLVKNYQSLSLREYVAIVWCLKLVQKIIQIILENGLQLVM